MLKPSPLKALAAVVREVGGDFVLEEIELDAPREYEVRVKLVGCGICHTDIAVQKGFASPLPIVLGHEGSGIVESVGDKVTKVKPGDSVVLSYDYCASCPNCRINAPAYCYNFFAHNFGGSRPDDQSVPAHDLKNSIYSNFFGQSSFAQYAIAHERNTVPVSSSLPLELLGPLGCGIQTGVGTVLNSMKIRPNESLIIFGGGAVGLSALLGAKTVDGTVVTVVEPNPARRLLATELGATNVVDPATVTNMLEYIQQLHQGGVQHAIDTTGIPSLIGTGVDSLMPNGTLYMIGVPPADATLPSNLLSMLLRGVGIKAVLEGDAVSNDFIPELIKLYEDGKLPFEKLIKKYKFSDINQAIKDSLSGATVKPILIF
ncbi:NAD(P)-dependent alcohol dehydrogenase [Zhongshania aliphaticivorans]|nr:NAD(P)-dependent alcohol dehydrogenase [Zhongshania aliphaticivorans]|tara:strand:- start:11800 stop:12918 length:1119 start_codon:yes stop_codon:yes gene_type:complete